MRKRAVKLCLLGMAWLPYTQARLLYTQAHSSYGDLHQIKPVQCLSWMGEGSRWLRSYWQSLAAVEERATSFRYGHLWVAHVPVDGPMHMHIWVPLIGLRWDTYMCACMYA